MTDDIKYNLECEANNGLILVDPYLEKYDSDSVVELSPMPNNGFKFTHWNDDLNNNIDPLKITMNDNIKIIANFEPYQLSREDNALPHTCSDVGPVTIPLPTGDVGLLIQCDFDRSTSPQVATIITCTFTIRQCVLCTCNVKLTLQVGTSTAVSLKSYDEVISQDDVDVSQKLITFTVDKVFDANKFHKLFLYCKRK